MDLTEDLTDTATWFNQRHVNEDIDPSANYLNPHRPLEPTLRSTSKQRSVFTEVLNNPDEHPDLPKHRKLYEQGDISENSNYRPRFYSQDLTRSILDHRHIKNQPGPFGANYNQRDNKHKSNFPTSGLKSAFEQRYSQTADSITNLQKRGLKSAFEQRMKMKDSPSNSTTDEFTWQPGSSGQYLQTNSQYSDPRRHGDFENNSERVEDGRNHEFVENLNGRSSRIHSIHRLKDLNHGSNLKQLYEARVGGLSSIRRSSEMVFENHANLIVSKMEQDETLMEDSPSSENLRRTALRDMPQCLTLKRSVKAKLTKNISLKSKRKPLGCFKMFKYRWAMTLSKFEIYLKDLTSSLELWSSPLKEIEGNFGTGVASFFKLLRMLFLVNLVLAFVSLVFIAVPKLSYEPNNGQSFGWGNTKDILTGQGYFENTSLYYGSYRNQSLPTFGTLTYSMSHAYFFTMVAIYFFAFLFFGISAARSYRRSFIETEGGLKNVYANKIFCGWDFNIATKDAAKLKSKAIFNELRECLAEFAHQKRKETCLGKFQTAIIQLFSHIVILAILTGTGFSIWELLRKFANKDDLLLVVVPIYVNLVMTLLPMFFTVIVKYEGYKDPRTMLNLTLVRTFVLGALTIGVLVNFWLNSSSIKHCWEDRLGEEIYRMIVFDFLISVVLAALIDVLLFGVYKLTKSSYLEFDIARNTMQLIYNQTLFWVGLLFSPLLPVVVVIKLFLTWYIRQFVVLKLCKPSARSWKAAQTTTWFLVMTFLSLLCVGGLLGFIVSYIKCSNICGPFTDYEKMYQILTFGVLQLKKNSTVWKIILYVTKPGVIALVLIGMSAKVYYLKAKAEATKEIVAQCRSMLIWSSRDKEFWINNISYITNGKWQYNLHENIDPRIISPNLIHLDDSERVLSNTSQFVSSVSSGIFADRLNSNLTMNSDSYDLSAKKFS